MSDLDTLARVLAPLVNAQVQAAVQQATRATRVPVVATGTVLSITETGDEVEVDMDDGGIEDAPMGSSIIAMRMSGVSDGDRVRVVFYPGGAAEAHKVET